MHLHAHPRGPGAPWGAGGVLPLLLTGSLLLLVHVPGARERGERPAATRTPVPSALDGIPSAADDAPARAPEQVDEQEPLDPPVTPSTPEL